MTSSLGLSAAYSPSDRAALGFVVMAGLSVW